MDVSNMTEEEQLQAAMKLSLQDAGLDGGGQAGPTVAAAGGGQASPPLRLPDRGKPRAFPSKDPQDVLTPPPPRGGFSAKKKRGEPRGADDQAGTSFQLREGEVAALLRLLFGDRPEAQDVERWFKVGFQFSPLAGTEWGLWQRHGGPCGIFAPVQAFIVKHLLFGGEDGGPADLGEGRGIGQRNEQPLSVSGAGEEDARAALLAYALASVLFQTAQTSSYAVCQVSLPEAASANNAAATAAATVAAGGASGIAVTGQRVTRASDAQQLFEEGVDSWLAGPWGVLSFLCSVLLSRSIDAVREDMDDPCNPLIGRFGHCSQDLVNLMLIGEATSNVFDGSRWLGDDPSSGFLVKGVDSDRIGVPPVGLLSELEPMRYLSVGALYKHPEYPIWVLASPTHYTLIFSTRRSDSQLSKEAQVEQRAKKVFTENSFDEGGLAMSSSLEAILQSLGIGMDKLAQATTDLVREEVILWEDFRAWACKQYGVAADGLGASGAGQKLKLFLYDGQDPPGPSLRVVELELSDIDPALAGGGSEGDNFAATLHTRWPNAVVQVQPLAGAAADGSSGNQAT